MNDDGIGGLFKTSKPMPTDNCTKCGVALRDDSRGKPGVIWCWEGDSLLCEFCCKTCGAEKAKRNEVLS